MNLLSYFVGKPKLVNFLTILLLIFGFFAVQRIQRESFPRVDFDILLINTVYPGASPQDVEVNVTIPIEQKLRGLDGIQKLESASRDGLSSLTVTIDPDFTDKERVKRNIQKALDQVNDLPAEVINRPAVFELKTDNFSVIQIALSSDRLGEKELREYGRQLKKRLERLSTVARVELQGFRQREIQIQADLNKLKINYLSLSDLVNLLRARNVRIPAGDVRNGEKAFSVVTEAKFQSLEEVRNTILRSNFEGEQVAVKDVATVEDTFAKYQELIKMNGELGVTLNVLKNSNADILRTIDQVRQEADVFAGEVKAYVKVNYINDVSKITRSTLGIVVSNALLGMLLVVVVLLIFLDWHTALWTTLGIPFALAITLVLMILNDVSLNNNSLIGLVIVLGMLVDDSIVIAESIYSARLRGLGPLEAARTGLKDVALPVLATVITTIVAFMPFLLLPGILGKFIRPIPIVVISALLGSLFEAYFILPNHLSGRKIKAIQPTSPELQERSWFPPLRDFYGRLLRRTLQHRFWLVCAFILLFIVSLGYAFTRMKFEVFPQNSLELMVFYLEAGQGTPLEKMAELTGRLEAVIKSQPAGAVDSFTTQIARGRNELPENENQATFILYFPPAAEQKVKDPRKIVAEVEMELSRMPEIIKVTQEAQKFGPPAGSDLEIRVIGNDNAARARLVNETESFLRSIRGIKDIEISEKAGKPELNLNFDFVRLARFGLTAADVGLALRTALEGSVVSQTYTPEERIDYRVLLQKRFREQSRTLEQLYVVNQQRQLVPIERVLEVSEKPTVGKIEHFDGDRVTRIFANLDRSFKITPVEMYKRVNDFYKQTLPAYSGVRYELGGGAQQSAEAFRDVGLAFILAFLLIYFILVLQFDSFLQPILIMITIPFGIVGVIWTFALHGQVFSFLSLLGVVGLTGIVVNDAIVMLNTINLQVKKKGCRTLTDYLEAALEGAQSRLRAILLTTITTVAGVLPTAYGLGGYVEQIAPVVLGLGWGLLFASTLTLFLVPALFVLEAQVEMRLASWLPWLPLKTQCENPFGSVQPLVRRKKTKT